MGRAAAGVRGMKLRADDEVVSCDVARDDVAILIVTDARLRQAHPARQVQPPGPRRPGRAAASSSPPARATSWRRSWSASTTRSSSSPRAASSIRMPVRDISSQGRDATGVRVMNLDDGQTVAVGGARSSPRRRGLSASERRRPARPGGHLPPQPVEVLEVDDGARSWVRRGQAVPAGARGRGRGGWCCGRRRAAGRGAVERRPGPDGGRSGGAGRCRGGERPRPPTPQRTTAAGW